MIWLVRTYRTEQVMYIEQVSDDCVDVWTGIVRGPLDGGGVIYRLVKEKGVWKFLNDGSSRGWVSKSQFFPLHIQSTTDPAYSIILRPNTSSTV